MEDISLKWSENVSCEVVTIKCEPQSSFVVIVMTPVTM